VGALRAAFVKPETSYVPAKFVLDGDYAFYEELEEIGPAIKADVIVTRLAPEDLIAKEDKDKVSLAELSGLAGSGGGTGLPSGVAAA